MAAAIGQYEHRESIKKTRIPVRPHRRSMQVWSMPNTLLISSDQLQTLIDGLRTQGYETMGPRLERGTIVYGPITSGSDLPAGFRDEQEGGHYRLVPSDPSGLEAESFFRYVVGPYSWKRLLFPPRQRLWRARRSDGGFALEPAETRPHPYAFIGVRACELAALAVQDRVFSQGDFADSGYRSQREQTFLIAVNCTRAGGTCFCASMHTGPRARGGFDLCLTELLDESGHRFLVEVGSEPGRKLMEQVSYRRARPDEIEQGRQAVEDAVGSMGRQMRSDAGDILRRNQEHPRWVDVANRCLSCANCTMVCPTCFCSTVEDVTSLDGAESERRRQWDSCFNLEFSYVHGGPVRREAAARYRQWITHKLTYWHEQFGTSGCTGCGRCITWCPVGIDITAEVAAIRDSERAVLEGEV